MRGKGKTTAVTFILSIFMVLAVLSPICHSASEGEETKGTPQGWSDDIDISENSNFDFDPSLAINGDTLHLVWYDAVPPSGPCHILYRKSTNAGASWSTTQTLATSVPFYHPQIAVNEDNVHLVWTDGDGWDGIYYQNSTDDGMSWNPIRRMTPTDSNAGNSHVYVNNSNVHITWHDWRSGIGGLNGQVFYRRSIDGGITFDNGQGADEDRQITFSPSTISGVDMVGDGSHLSILWGDERDGSFQVYWMISRDNGYTWEDGQGNENLGLKISNNSPNDCIDHAIDMDGTNISIVWTEMRWPGPYYRLYYRNSSDMGVTWSPIQLLGGPLPALYHPDIDIVGNVIHLTWGEGYINLNPHYIKYMNSTDWGNIWNGNITLSYDAANDLGSPKIVTNNETLHFVWRETLPDNSKDLFYKRYPEFPVEPEPPMIFHTPVTTANGMLQIPIYVNVTEDGAYGVYNVTLYYKNIGDSEFSYTNMTFLEGSIWNGTWTGKIPVQNQSGLLSYYIVAFDHSNNMNQTIEYQIDVYDWPWPHVTSVSPMSNEKNVCLTTTFSISFSMPMNTSSVENSFSYSNGTAEWTSAEGAWNWDITNTTGTFTPYSPLQSNTKYFINFNSSIATEKDGHHLDGNNDTEYTTPHTWQPREDMLPFGDRYMGSTTLNGLIYSIGGNGGSTSVEIYNPANDTWYYGSPLHIGREMPTASACNGKIYVIGGENPSGNKVGVIEEYDPILDQWILKASLQKARYLHAATVVEDKIYILGGNIASGATTSIEVYDTTLNITYEETNLTFARRYLGAVTYNGFIYVVGGLNSASIPIQTTERYNLTNGSWETLQVPFMSRYGHQLQIFQDHIYMICGRGSYTSVVPRYNPYLNQWTNVTTTPTLRGMGGSGMVDGKIYAFGGLDGPNYYSHDIYIPNDDFYSIFTTGEPSTFNISLIEGWNLISLPLAQSNESINQVFSSIAGKWDYVQYYDASDPSDHWKTYGTFKPEQLNDLRTLNHKMGFWINITEPGVSLTVGGYEPTSTSITLYAGWNLVGYPTQTTETVANALWGTGADRVEKFDAVAPYRISEVGPSYVMKPGEGYWVHVPADSVWIIDW